MLLALNDTDRFCDVRLVKGSLGDSSGIDFATYAEPPNYVVTETGPDGD
jgi:hypothetical protein